MIFKGVDNPKCIYCEYSTAISNSDMLMCEKKGEVKKDYLCRKYRFDIFKCNFKRKKQVILDKFDKKDFEL
ncbi:MAG: hypothetical protein E7404_08275 [Ruminococcaceae bacterium]|nr:hypothetical protein [Oscillospiraceae bacterium]